MGFVTDSGGLHDGGLNQSIWEGVQQARSDSDLIANFIETENERDGGHNLAFFADQDYDLIITAGYGLSQPTVDAATAYPEILFLSVGTESGADLPNLAVLTFPEDQAGFLAGALAAHMSETMQIGGVFAHSEIPSVKLYSAGFYAGAIYVQPEIKVDLVFDDDASFSSSLRDVEWGAQQADALMDRGADVLFGYGGSTAGSALSTAARRGVRMIGVEAEWAERQPETRPYLIGDIIPNAAPFVFEIIRQIRLGVFRSGILPGSFTLVFGNDSVPTAVRAALQQLQVDLQNGMIQVGDFAPLQ